MWTVWIVVGVVLGTAAAFVVWLVIAGSLLEHLEDRRHRDSQPARHHHAS